MNRYEKLPLRSSSLCTQYVLLKTNGLMGG